MSALEREACSKVRLSVDMHSVNRMHVNDMSCGLRGKSTPEKELTFVIGRNLAYSNVEYISDRTFPINRLMQQRAGE
jgi:hypothetical protein